MIYRDEIENVLLRRKIFNMLASYTEITYTDADAAQAIQQSPIEQAAS